MIRFIPLILAALLTGCTVAWHDLRMESKSSSGWQCPKTLGLTLNSGHTTHIFGTKEEKPTLVKEKELRYRHLAEQILQRRGCGLKDSANGGALNIEIVELQQLSALPQEWLTGLSLGLIPSWGTRRAEIQFKFSQDQRVAVYSVDDKRINHLVLFPIFWISFLLPDSEKEFEKAFNDFATGL